MCESAVFVEEAGVVREVMREVTRIVMQGTRAVCTDIVGQQLVLEDVTLKEANFLSHGIVFQKTR